MKKKQRCFFKRFAALVAALVISFSFAVPAFASNSEAAMPSVDDFSSRPGNWYVWRTVGNFYELIASPLVFDGIYLADNASYTQSYSNIMLDVTYNFNTSSTRSYACAIPITPFGVSSNFSDLPSFPVGLYHDYRNATFRFYPTNYTSGFLDSLYCFVTPVSSSGDHILSHSPSTDTFDSASFFSPFVYYPFAWRSDTSTNHTSYGLVGGSQKFADSNAGFASPSGNTIGLATSRFLSSPSELSQFPPSYTYPSSGLGVVFVKRPDSSYITTASSYKLNVTGVFTLLVSSAFLPGVEVGDWISKGSLDKLQDQLVNDFDVDSDTLKNSKDNLNSWNSTSSVDSDVASGATGLLNGIFQNLGTFLFSVSLLCFGAVVLRMLIRKAVDG